MYRTESCKKYLNKYTKHFKKLLGMHLEECVRMLKSTASLYMILYLSNILLVGRFTQHYLGLLTLFNM